MSIPFWVKQKMKQFSTFRSLPERNRIPFSPELIPLILMLRMITTSFAPATTTIPLVPLTSVEATWPPPPSRVIALVMVTAPNPPGSRASISPPGAVFEMAPAHVLQGAVRLHGLASSPTPATQVRLSCACNIVVPSSTIAKRVITLIFFILMFPLHLSDLCGRYYSPRERLPSCGFHSVFVKIGEPKYALWLVRMQPQNCVGILQRKIRLCSIIRAEETTFFVAHRNSETPRF